MVGLLITGHAHFATGIGSSLQLVAGLTDNIKLVDFEETHSTETLTANLNAALDELKQFDGVLVMSDLAGGSPFKAAVECKFARPDQNIEVMAGTNLPMLLEAFMMVSAFDSPLDVANMLLGTAADHIVRFELPVREEVNEEEDGI
jgi:PTS system N-acetylgalactosamine-specific IIA component